jgi:hypothetical protein
VQLSYQLTESDYRQGFKAFRTRTAYRRWLIRIAYFIFFFMVVLGLLTTFARRAFGELWPLYLLLLFWGYYLWYGPYMIGRRTMKGSPSARTPRTIDITDAGLHDQNNLADSRVDWKVFVGWAENDKVFALFPSSMTFIPIPKRAMTSAQQEEFRALLKSRFE